MVAGIGFTLNMVLLKRYSPGTVVSFGFILPVSGVLAAAWLLGDPLTGHVAAGTAAVAVGLILVMRGK